MAAPGTIRIHHLVGAAVVLMVGAGHGAHDLLNGDPWPSAFLPTVGLLAQAAILSACRNLARRRGWPSPWVAAVLVIASIPCGAFTMALHSRRPHGLVDWAAISAVVGLGTLALWFLVLHLPEELNEARARALEAESERRKAELDRLRASLQPHFLLNTLNAVAGLLAAEPRQARELLVALGDLLRDSLEGGEPMRSLEAEVEWLRRYARIFEIRHQGAVRFEWDLAPETMAAALPRLLLQPLVENAVSHGALRRPGGGTVRLRSQPAGGWVRISVSDDGPGMDPERPRGLGLQLVNDRLRLASPAARMRIDTSHLGTCITLELPARQVTA
jgi:signal transduction histidine kinase